MNPFKSKINYTLSWEFFFLNYHNENEYVYSGIDYLIMSYLGYMNVCIDYIRGAIKLFSNIHIFPLYVKLIKYTVVNTVALEPFLF